MKKRKIVKRKISRREIELKMLILQMGMRMVDIAKETGFSISMLSRYIRDERNSEKLDKYFEKLKDEYEDFMNRFRMQVDSECGEK